jgi:serine O-acetyltransferase
MLYRMGRWCRLHGLRVLAALIDRFMHHLCFCTISTSADIGGGFYVAHPFGLVVGADTRLGEHCDLRQNITFGGNYNKTADDGRQKPWLGDNVSVGAGAVILGPVKVGSNVIIGANAVVIKDVPDNAIVGGVPARVIKEKWDETTGRGL